jgi:hypothetical protein
MFNLNVEQLLHRPEFSFVVNVLAKLNAETKKIVGNDFAIMEDISILAVKCPKTIHPRRKYSPILKDLERKQNLVSWAVSSEEFWKILLVAWAEIPRMDFHRELLIL